MLFPKFYVDNDKFGIQNKVQFIMHYQNLKKKTTHQKIEQIKQSLK